jgi:hypothetical protein
MKGLAQKLTEDNLIIKNYIIVPSSEKLHTHKLFMLTEEFCLELATLVKNPYDPIRPKYKCDHSGRPHGTARGAVTQEIWEHFGDVRYLKILKFKEDEKDNSVLEEYINKI